MMRLVLSLLVLGLLAVASPTHAEASTPRLTWLARSAPNSPADRLPEPSLENELEEIEADDDDQDADDDVSLGRVSRFAAGARPPPSVPRGAEAARIRTSMATQRGPPAAPASPRSRRQA